MYQFLTIEEAAEMAKVSDKVIRALIESGDLPAKDVSTGKRHYWRIDPNVFVKWMRNEL